MIPLSKLKRRCQCSPKVNILCQATVCMPLERYMDKRNLPGIFKNSRNFSLQQVTIQKLWWMSWRDKNQHRINQSFIASWPMIWMNWKKCWLVKMRLCQSNCCNTELLLFIYDHGQAALMSHLLFSREYDYGLLQSHLRCLEMVKELW